MPIGRYFLYIGSVLLALLYVADWYLPPGSNGQSRPHVDRYTIRIHSAQKWPTAVVIDTTQPTLVPPPVVAAVETPKPAREAYAMATEPVPLPAARPAEAGRPAKQRVHRTKTARGSNNRLAAHDDMSGFGNDWFAPARREASASANRALGARGFWTMSW
jgi:hypothetical protein